MLHGRVSTPRRRDLDVADIDRRPLAPEIYIANLEIDVGVVDLASDGLKPVAPQARVSMPSRRLVRYRVSVVRLGG